MRIFWRPRILRALRSYHSMQPSIFSHPPGDDRGDLRLDLLLQIKQFGQVLRSILDRRARQVLVEAPLAERGARLGEAAWCSSRKTGGTHIAGGSSRVG